ncbi:MAG: ATP-binding protein [Chitinophagales bacterium]
MKLIELSYQDKNWDIQNLKFDAVNLIVGKNSVGKSRTLAIIDLFYKIITQKKDLNFEEEWNVKFENNKKEIIEYCFSAEEEKGVFHESLLINNTTVLKRNDSFSAAIKSNTTSNWHEINPPSNKLILHIRRDVKEYPFLEDIISWAEHSYGFKFAHITPSASFLAEKKYSLLTNVANVSDLFSALKKQNKENVILNLNNLGYNIESIEDVEVMDALNDFFTLLIKEKDLKKRILLQNLSQGMFRALSILIYLEYLIYQKKPATIVIDDLCEGLDYERATKLGKLIFNKCMNTNIQLIATSNDSFLMDVVDIKYWNVLQREGKIVTAINIQTHEALFKKFKFTGLSNFDFFASDYIKPKI